MFLPSCLSPLCNEQFEENGSVTSRLAAFGVTMREAAVLESEPGIDAMENEPRHYRPVTGGRQVSIFRIHESSRRMKLSDRMSNEITLGEVERIAI
jgi:hypothetical protein